MLKGDKTAKNNFTCIFTTVFAYYMFKAFRRKTAEMDAETSEI